MKYNYKSILFPLFAICLLSSVTSESKKLEYYKPVGLSFPLDDVNFAVEQKHRSASFPYVSADTFRSISDHVLEYAPCMDIPPLTFDYKNVQPGDVIFVHPACSEKFFTEYHPKISNPYILITHNYPISITKKYRNYLDDSKLIAWFAENPDIDDHPKLHAIPLGIPCRWSKWHSIDPGVTIEQTNNWRKRTQPTRDILLYGNFAQHTNPVERVPPWTYFKSKKYTTFSAQTSREGFYKHLAKSKFVLSPHGLGLDCFRTWEALLLGAFPIVKTSTLDILYKDLPVIIVHDWEEITEEFLNDTYKKMSTTTYNFDRLYFSYWWNQIRNLKIKHTKNTVLN